MRLPTDVRTRFLAKACVLGLTLALGACGRFGGGDRAELTSVSETPVQVAAYGPEADFPRVVGQPYDIGGKTYSPVDTMNYDEVGYVALDSNGGSTISVAHKTLPYPSYVEITSLATGKTILARVERRGPISNDHVVGMSAGAATQLGVDQNAPVRIRRVKPPEADRIKLRMGQAAADRMNTPNSLLAVLKRSLPTQGSVSLASSKQNPTVARASTPSRELPAMVSDNNAAPVSAKPTVAPARPATAESFARAFTEERKTVTAYPLKPLSGATPAVAAAKRPARPPRVSELPRVQMSRNAAPATVQPAPKVRQAPAVATNGAFVVQAAAFSSEANAKRAANSIDGFIQKSGRYYRVRTGPFTNRGQAEAALAKVRAAGYSDARVFTAG